MKYIKPKDVKSPRSYVQTIKPLYDGGCKGFSIAILEDINGDYHVGMRWNTVFAEFIERPYKQLLLGNTEHTYNLIRKKMEEKGKDKNYLIYMPLPFLSADEFDYTNIAKEINNIHPDIIWVSLGAPK